MKKKPTSRDLQAAERRGQLLEAAIELFSKQGYHATPVREINRKIGMADGLLYHYFPGGKLEILQTIVYEAKDRRMEFFDSSAQQIPQSSTLREVLLQLFESLNDILERERDILRIQIREQELLEGEIIREIEEMLLSRLNWMTDLLRARGEAGEIRKMDYAYATSSLLSIWLGIAFQSLTGVDVIRMDRQEYFTKMTDHILSTWRP